MPNEIQLAAYYSELDDVALIDAHRAGSAAYDEHAWRIIDAEYKGRGLQVALDPADHASPEPPSASAVRDAAGMLAHGMESEALIAKLRASGAEQEMAERLASEADSYLVHELKMGKAEVRSATRRLAVGAAILAVTFIWSPLYGLLRLFGAGLLISGAIDVFRGNSRLGRARGVDPIGGSRRRVP